MMSSPNLHINSPRRQEEGMGRSGMGGKGIAKLGPLPPGTCSAGSPVLFRQVADKAADDLAGVDAFRFAFEIKDEAVPQAGHGDFA